MLIITFPFCICSVWASVMSVWKVRNADKVGKDSSLEEAYWFRASLEEWKDILTTWMIGWDWMDIIGELNCPHNQWERILKADLRNLDFFFFFFFAALCDLWDFSSPSRDWTQAPQQLACRVLTTGPPGKSWIDGFTTGLDLQLKPTILKAV